MKLRLAARKHLEASAVCEKEHGPEDLPCQILNDQLLRAALDYASARFGAMQKMPTMWGMNLKTAFQVGDVLARERKPNR